VRNSIRWWFDPLAGDITKTATRGLIAHRNEGTLPRLVVAPQHLLAICEAEGVVLRARRGRGPEVSFSRNDLTQHEKHGKLCLIGACLDGFLLTMRSMEYLSATTTFDPLTALSRADVPRTDLGRWH
jgi:hypothetical protein